MTVGLELVLVSTLDDGCCDCFRWTLVLDLDLSLGDLGLGEDGDGDGDGD